MYKILTILFIAFIITLSVVPIFETHARGGRAGAGAGGRRPVAGVGAEGQAVSRPGMGAEGRALDGGGVGRAGKPIGAARAIQRTPSLARSAQYGKYAGYAGYVAPVYTEPVYTYPQPVYTTPQSSSYIDPYRYYPPTGQ